MYSLFLALLERRLLFYACYREPYGKSKNFSAAGIYVRPTDYLYDDSGAV